MDVVGITILLVLFMLGILWLISVVDAARQPEEFWHAAGRGKPGWMLRLFLAGWVAGLFYWAFVRPELTAARLEGVRRPERQRMPLRRKDWGDPWAND